MNDYCLPMQLGLLTENIEKVKNKISNVIDEKREMISENFSYFKSELSQIAVKVIPLPVNNFLKELSDFERDFRNEVMNRNEFLIMLDGELVTESEVLSRPMEENY